MGRAWEHIVLPTRSVFQKQRVQGFHFWFVSETVWGRPIGHSTFISPTWLVARTRLFGQYNLPHTDKVSAQSFLQKIFCACASSEYQASPREAAFTVTLKCT